MSETSSSRERFRRADALFDAALDLPPEERDAFVAVACADDDALRDVVARLLRAESQSADFLARPAAEAAASLLVAEDAVVRARLQRALGGVYRVERRLALGGMATVYLALDTRHDRAVAVKVLDAAGDSAFAGAAGAARFLAEIRVTAKLQHPNVLPLFDSGAANGLLYYVMPFVDGETLRARLLRESPLPVDEAVRIALGVAGAVSYAHAQGVVHRDLKPENVFLRAGQPIVADFGIALARSEAAAPRVTRTGVSVGTPQYMSPEQASGESAIDARADVYALGAMLFEMLTGDPPLVASSAQTLLAKVRAERPSDVRVLRPATPAHLARAVARALEKRPADRPATMAALAAEIGGAGARRGPFGTRRRALAGAGAALVAAAFVAAAFVAAAFGIVAWSRARGGGAPTETTETTSRFVIAPAPDAAIGPPPTITPDGSRLVYAGSAATGRRLFVRPISALSAAPLAGTEGALSAFVSPNGRWVAFFTSDDKLRKVAIDGGAVTTLAGSFRYSEGAWASDDGIVVANFLGAGLSWVPASGGGMRPLTRLDDAAHETRHAGPLALDDGRTIVFTVDRERGGPVAAMGELAIVSLDPTHAGPTRHTLLGVTARQAIGVVPGWLLFTSADGATLMAIRFDPAHRRVVGALVPVLEHPDANIDAAALARTGTLLYTRSSGANAPVVVDASGTARPLVAGLSGGFMSPRLSPDGRRLAIQRASAQGTDVWVYDVASGASTRVTTNGRAIGPTWTPDGRRLVYFSQDAGSQFWSAAVDGSAPPEPIVAAPGGFAATITADGRTLVYQRHVGEVWQLWATDLEGPRRTRLLAGERFDCLMPAVSPDGRWLAYVTNATGRNEVYVRPLGTTAAPVQISDSGGTEPAWSADGRRVYFRGDRRLLAATIETRPALAVTSRATLFSDTFDGDMPMPHRNYDVMRDGRHFVMIGAEAGSTAETVVVLGWLTEMRRRLAGR